MLFHGLKGVTAEDIYQQGLSAWEKGDFESAAKFFEDAAQKNHPGAMLKLADMYGYGQYFTCNAQKETDYTIRAAEAGLAEAQAILATMYAEGHFNILPKDMLTASTWLTKSLDQDCEIAYAIALLYGLCGFPKDLQQSADCLRNIIGKQEDDHAAVLLAGCLLEMDQYDLQAEELIPLLNKLTERQISQAYGLLAVLQHTLKGTPLDDEDMQLFQKTIDKEDITSMALLGMIFLAEEKYDEAQEIFKYTAQYHSGIGIWGQALEQFKKEMAQADSPEAETQARQNMRKQMKYAAELGCSEALFHLANDFLPEDPETAASYYFQSAMSGNGEASYALGVMTADGFAEMPPDPQRAVSYFKEAICRKEAGAHTNMAKAYILGDGVETDQFAAFGHFCAAAHKGVPEGMFHYGNMLYLGTLGFTETEEGLEWIKQAADLKHPEAMFTYALYSDPDCKSGKMLDLIVESASLGFAGAQTLCGLKYLHGDGCEANPEKAFDYFLAAADQGHADAQFWLGIMLREKDPDAAVSTLRKAADQNNFHAMYELGCIFMEHNDYVHAFPLLETAAQQGIPDAAEALAKIYEKGLGLPKDRKYAEFLYDSARGQRQKQQQEQN